MTMTNEELTMLHSHMDTSRHYLEFGSGDSTIYASCVPGIKTIDSIESSKGFVENILRKNFSIQNAETMGKLEFHFIDIGETGNFGYPVNDSKRHQWPNYSKNIFKDKSDHDLVLVDGRFRVACTLHSILNTQKDCTIMIHDFWNRPEYHLLLEYLHPEDRVNTLGVFSKKYQNLNLDEVHSLISQYQFFPEDKISV